jgi:hypothetical protein
LRRYPRPGIGNDEEAAMFTISYNATREALYHPEKAINFFFPQDVDDFFTRDPLPSEAALCAEMSRLAYVDDEGQLKEYLKRANFTRVKVVNYGKRGTQFFVATKSSEVAGTITVVAFRGTQSGDITDVFTDAVFLKAPWDKGGQVHLGFREMLPDMETLAHLIPDSKRVLYTGHSLGAALATLAAARHRPNHLYTFGSPAVGDQKFAASMVGVNHSRYVDCCDLVTRVPPAFARYVHVGELHYIDQYGKITRSPSNRVMEKDRRRASMDYLLNEAPVINRVLAREGADHAPINYVSAVMRMRSTNESIHRSRNWWILPTTWCDALRRRFSSPRS